MKIVNHGMWLVVIGLFTAYIIIGACGDDDEDDWEDDNDDGDESEDEGNWDDDDSDGLSLDLGDAYPCPSCGAAVPDLGMAHFSFNKPAGACPTCTGLGTVREGNLARLLDETKSVLDGGVLTWDRHQSQYYSQTLENAGRRYGFTFDTGLPINTLVPIAYPVLLLEMSATNWTWHWDSLTAITLLTTSAAPANTYFRPPAPNARLRDANPPSFRSQDVRSGYRRLT